jgi:predicted 2-oxoglutarate/Fe(II)-dependent dioxygenase YbiX
MPLKVGPFKVGESAPWFKAPTLSEPEFAFEAAAGRYVLLAFLPLDDAGRLAALQALAAYQANFDLGRLVAFVVVRDPQTVAGGSDLRALRWMLDPDQRVSRLFDPGGDGTGAPAWMLLDPSLRIMAIEPLHRTAAFFQQLDGLPAPADHAGVPLHAPVLTVPRVFEPELCQRLIALHQADGGRFTGVMRDQGERTVAVMDELKKRRDILLRDPEIVALIRSRLDRRLLPMIERCLGFTVTQIERYLVSCYDAQDGGVFHAHRDSTTQGTAHRKFACSINLNDDFEGGDLRFAEFGAATYRPPLGGAVVFSCALMHEARPVKRGRRYAFLPFLHDEAGAAVLAAYEARIGEADAVAS